MDSMGPFNGDKPLAVWHHLNAPDFVATLEFRKLFLKPMQNAHDERNPDDEEAETPSRH